MSHFDKPFVCEMFKLSKNNPNRDLEISSIMPAPWTLHPAKRVFDLALAFCAGVLLLPVLIGVALAVRLCLGAPVFFRQRRPGLLGNPFTLIKFRTMRSGPESDAERMTRLGRFLRKSGLDELPELWNILRGDMSFVGPRPLLMAYLDLYTPEQARRHEIRPGLTGWAQIHGRNQISWEEKFACDVWYVDHASFKRDLWILWQTLRHPGGGGDPIAPFAPQSTASEPVPTTPDNTSSDAETHNSVYPPPDNHTH